MGCSLHFSGHAIFTVHVLLTLFYLSAFCCHPEMKDIEQDAAVAGIQTIDPHNNDYITSPAACQGLAAMHC